MNEEKPEVSSFEVEASKALFMAQTAKKKVALARTRLTDKAWNTCKDEVCDHKFLGFKYFSHKQWENREEFVKIHPIMQHLNMTMDLADSVCDSVITAAEYKLANPDETQLIRLSLGDFSLINGDI